MWRNPNATETPQPNPTAPTDHGRPLATIPRNNGPVRAELRASLQEWNGHPYISLRVWEFSNGQFWPVKGKGLSIRLSEAEAVARALGLGWNIATLARRGLEGNGARRPGGPAVGRDWQGADLTRAAGPPGLEFEGDRD